MPLRVLFMGTPEFAIPSLQALLNSPEFDVVGVVTQPDKPQGRGLKLTASPVKVLAQQNKLPLFQPEHLRKEEEIAPLAALKPEVIVVAAFGQLLRPAVLELAPHGCVNVHASLLPRWRGAAPISAAILAGDKETGITLMKLDEGLDTGPIIARQSLAIAETETTATLEIKLAQLGADLLCRTLPHYIRGECTLSAQAAELATYAPRLKKEEAAIDWQKSAVEIERQIRAFNPRPGAFCCWQGNAFHIWLAHTAPDVTSGAHPGDIKLIDGKTAAIVTGNGLLLPVEVQPAGKRKMPISEFLRGARDFIGDSLAGADCLPKRAL
jgi:methionyl-tRNA formyltransferase